jgi:hypothetical protein
MLNFEALLGHPFSAIFMKPISATIPKSNSGHEKRSPAVFFSWSICVHGLPAGPNTPLVNLPLGSSECTSVNKAHSTAASEAKYLRCQPLFRFNSGSRTANFIWAHGGLLPLTKRPKAAWGNGRCPPRNSFEDQSSCLKRVLSVSQLLMLFAGRFFPQKFCVFFVHTFPKQHPPSMVRGV